MASKKDLSERDICTQFILPALKKSGWNIETQVREEVSFPDGRIYVRGNKTTRGKRKRADFILYFNPNIPIAIIEAKSNKLSVNAGIQQGIWNKVSGGATPMVNRSKWETILLPLPPYEEQFVILEKIENLFKICDEDETQINSSKVNSEMLMQAVLKEAFEK